MCCHYYIDPDTEVKRGSVKSAESSPLKERLERELKKPMLTAGEVRPTDLVPVIAPDKSRKMAIFPMIWGFHLPRSKTPIINAQLKLRVIKRLFAILGRTAGALFRQASILSGNT